MYLTSNHNRQSLGSLYGLRFVACFLILISHINMWAIPAQLQAGAFEFSRYLPGIAMPLFFTLSGFLIHYFYHREENFSRSDLKSYYIARIARIYPLYLLLIPFYYYSSGVSSLLNFNEKLQILLMFFTGTEAWSYGLFHQTLSVSLFFVTAWSVSVEVFFYLIYPLFSKYIARLQLKQSVVALAAFLVLSLFYMYLCYLKIAATPELLMPDSYNSFQLWWFYVSPYVRILDFVTGCITAQIFLRMPAVLPRNIQRLFHWAFIAILVALPLWFNLLLHSQGFARQLLFTFGFTPLVAGIIFYSALFVVISKGIIKTTLMMLGNCSFSLYLLQEIILKNFSLSPPQEGGFGLDYWGIVCLYVIAMISIALISYQVFERPLRNYIRRKFGLDVVSSS